MANPEHLAQIQKGGTEWNRWRERFPNLGPVDLTEANLIEANLHGANLSGANLRAANLSAASLSGANLNDANLDEANLRAANLHAATLTAASMRRADLSGAHLSEANLVDANLRVANLIEANLSKANLSRANLHTAQLRGADLRGAILTEVILRGAILTEANLRWADLRGADLFGATLAGADISASDLGWADLRNTNLQNAKLTNSLANGIMLWETQRAGWSIKGVVCERAYWDREAKEPTSYTPGEFERLYSDQTCIELFYQGGVSTFELNTLPALLQHLASLHPETNIRLKSIEETGGGAKISISVGDVPPAVVDKIKADAARVYQSQLALRDKETERLQIERDYIERLFIGKLIPAMITAGSPQNVFNAPVTGVVIPSGQSKVEYHQTVNDNTAILDLLEKIMERHADLGLSITDANELKSEFRLAKAELQRRNPDRSAMSKSLQTIEEIVKGALANFVGGAAAAAASANWQTWMDQLGQIIPHLK
jgi:uncharacterized protein YjbI with pentapeptide repeats